MAGENNFLVWNAGEVNQEDDAAYLIDALRVGGAPTNALFSSLLANKLFYQVTMMAAAIAQCVSVAGQDALDTDLNDLANAIWNTFQPFPSGTVLGSFFQPAAPVGWTQITTQNDKALRVVSGVGGGSGGVHDLSSPPSIAHIHTGPSHSHAGVDHLHATSGHILSAAEMPSHNHLSRSNFGGNLPGSSAGEDNDNSNSYDTSYTGGGASHSHGNTGMADRSLVTGLAGAGNTGTTTPTAFSPKYIDVIVCSKN